MSEKVEPTAYDGFHGHNLFMYMSVIVNNCIVIVYIDPFLCSISPHIDFYPDSMLFPYNTVL